MIFRTQCAWCGRILKEEPCSESMAQLAVNPETNVLISHGICPDCRRRLEREEFPKQGGDNDA
jgi:predicted amidophosphoribosyltransferase